MLSWRNLWRRTRRTLVLVAAIAAGMAAIVVTAAFMRGIAERTVHDALANLLGDVQLHAPGYRDNPSVRYRFALDAAELRAALDSPQVAAYAARVRVPAVVSSERRSMPVTLVGIDPPAEQVLSFLGEARIEGRGPKDIEDAGLLIGQRMAERLGTAVGRRIVLMSQGEGNVIADRGFRVVGIYEANPKNLEIAYVFTGRATAQALLGIGGDVTQISLRAAPGVTPEALAAALSRQLPELDAAPWPELAPMAAGRVQLNQGFTLIWFTVVAVAMVIGLVNTLLMAVFERTRELGLFQALGLPPRAIVLQVVCETALILAAGIALGGLLGWIAIVGSGEGIDVSAFARGAERAGLNTRLPLIFDLRDLVLTGLAGFVVGIAAGLYPAWRATRAVPVEAITRT
ncbi:MAG: ABC transporter permease [Chromatocurvus sp.]